MKVVSLEEIINNRELLNTVIKKITIASDRMFKNKAYLKSKNGIEEDLRSIVSEIKEGKSFFKVIFDNDKNVIGMFYISINDKEKFLEPFLNTDLFYSETPKSFFKTMNEAKKSLAILKEKYPNVRQYMGYYTLDEKNNPLSHAKLANKRVKEVLRGEEKEVFITYIISKK